MFKQLIAGCDPQQRHLGRQWEGGRRKQGQRQQRRRTALILQTRTKMTMTTKKKNRIFVVSLVLYFFAFSCQQWHCWCAWFDWISVSTMTISTNLCLYNSICLISCQNLIRRPTFALWQENIGFYHFTGIWAIPLFSCLPHQNHPGSLLEGCFLKRSKSAHSINYVVYLVTGSQIIPSITWYFTMLWELRILLCFYGVSGFCHNKLLLQLFYRSFSTAIPKYYRILISNFLRL